jgi:hypothetical protein
MEPTGFDVAAFLGQGDDATLVALADEHLPIVTAMVRSYTRGNGFTGTSPADDIRAVILTATARLMANPEQLGYQRGSVSLSGGFTGWSLAETFVLNRYRKRAA